MKPTPSSVPDTSIVAFGAHPDDIEFGCGGVIALESRRGSPVHLVVCSRGEAGTHGTPEVRTREAEAAAEVLGASLEWLELDGDSRLETRAEHAVRLARVIRERKPSVVLAPTLVQNQHPDHWRLGQIARDAARLARYGGVEELMGLEPHAIGALFFYALGLESEPRDTTPVLVDVSDAGVVSAWTSAMEAHASQVTARGYVEMQLARARLRGMSAGREYAIALFPNDPAVVGSLAPVCLGARRF
jgi:LmbE family N-acetylglucosaminyl deacetylase